MRLFYCAYSSQSCAKVQNAFSAVLRWAVAGVMVSRSPFHRRSTGDVGIQQANLFHHAGGHVGVVGGDVGRAASSPAAAQVGF